MSRRIFITVAEVSGDKHAGQLIRSILAQDPSIQIEAIGGPEMSEAGAHVHHETTRAAAMSFYALARALDVVKLLRWTRRHFEHNRPDLLICVDSPAMNFHFAKLAHGMGIPVLYYIAPQLWAWREGRMKKLRRWVDHVACILPFEEQYFRRHNVNATFVGHPLFDELPQDRSRADGRGARDPANAPVIGLLAGSRSSEANANFPHLLDVAQRIAGEIPHATFLSPTTEATDPIVRERAARATVPIEVGLNQFDAMVPRCDLCITVSGTATLHVAGWHVPMIVVYRGNPILWHAVARWLIKTRTYSLVNLLADAHQHIVPEFVPWYGSNRPVADYAIELLREPRKLDRQRAALTRLVRTLDRPGASANAARLAFQMIDNERTTIMMHSDEKGVAQESDAAR